MAQSIAAKVAVTVTGQEQSSLIASRHVSPEVYESYLRGQVGTHNTQAELEQSIAYFENAIAKDPTFAPAYLGLANAYENLSLILVGAPPGQMRPKVIQAAQRRSPGRGTLANSIRAEPLALTSAGFFFHARRYDQAIRELRSVVAVHPDSAFAHWYLSFTLIGQSHPAEAILECEKTVALMNRSAGSLELLATTYGYAGRRSDALRALDE